MKRKQEGKDERNRCYPNSNGAICLFGLCTSNSHTMGIIQFPPDYTVFLAVKTHTMDPTPSHATAITQTAIVKGAFKAYINILH